MDRFIKKSKFLKCFITNISCTQNEIEIWCQTDTKMSSRVETSLDMIHNQMSDLFAINSQNLRPIPIPEVGRNYLTHMKNDLHFHRVVVTHIEEDTTRASVLFIDFGIEDWVPFNHLVEFDELFKVEPLAHKYFLADIHTKDNEWNSEEVKRCLQPFLMSIFQSEVIAVKKNTECIRVYDSFFNQPLVQSLVNYCNGFLTYPSFGKEIFEAIDLSTDKSNRNKMIATNSVQINAISNKQKTEIKAIPQEAFPQKDKIQEELKANKENVCPISQIETITETTNNCNNKEIETQNKVNETNSVQNESSDETTALDKQSLPSEQEVTEKEDILDKSKTSELNDIALNVVGDPLNGHNISDVDKEEEPTVTQEPEVISTEMNDKTTSEEVNVHQSKECDVNKPIPENNVDSIEPIVEEMTKCNGKSNVSALDQNSRDSVDSPQKLINEKVAQKEEVLTTEAVVDLCPYPEIIGGKRSIYLTHSLSDKFFAQFSSQFDVINKLSERMTDYYNKIYDSDKCSLNLNSVKVNDIIAARFSQDFLWYRAAVKANTGNKLDLIYLDYGNEETVDVKECKQLVDDFATKDLKPQALLCQSIGEKLSEETLIKYINDVSEVESEFVDFQNDCFKIKILSVK